MNLLARLVVLASIGFAAPLAAQDSPQMSDEQTRQVQLALSRGEEIWRYDQAAWHATDALVEDVADLENSGIRGWVVTPEAGGLLVTFWRHEGEGYAGVYSALYDGEQVARRRVLNGVETQLKEVQVALIRAQATIDPRSVQSCSPSPFNTVTLPSSAQGEPILVYLLTPQTSANSIPLGGHYRFAVQDGAVVNQRQFMNSCLEMPMASRSTEVFVVSHLLDPVPTEIHVFSAMASRTPIMVLTVENEHIWSVSSGDDLPTIGLAQIGIDAE